ncbi:MAG: asparaginase [Lachnospiraceae bacterium]|jgi:L-asparaginase|nr:asparaginase [Lachnospiraceae bacterium]
MKEKKRILMLTTGGTIASAPTDRGLAPALRADELLKGLEDLRESCRIDTLEVCSLDSTNMTWAHWLKLEEAVEAHYKQYDGFVICHGTDTMAYTAGALSYLIQNPGKPIVLTGSQKPITQEITDAKRNLRDSIAAAMNEDCHGVQIVFNGQIIAGTRAKKVKSFSFDAFTSINFPVLGVVRNGRVIRYVREELPLEPPVFYHRVHPRVFLLKLIPGMQPQILKPIFQEFDCVIVESFGVGGIPDSIAEEFFRQLSRYEPGEKILIMTTQVTYEGSDVDVYEVGKRIRERFRFLEAYDMTLEAVFTKIMWILGIEGLSFEEIETLFYRKVNFDTSMTYVKT